MHGNTVNVNINNIYSHPANVFRKHLKKENENFITKLTPLPEQI